MSDFLTKLVYLTDEQYTSLLAGTLTGHTLDPNALYITDTNLTTNDPTAANTATAFITSISQNAQGKITASKANLPTASTSIAGIIQIGTESTNAAAGNHGHGNISNDGKSTSNSIIGSNVAVTTGHKFLREDGSWVVPAYTTDTDTWNPMTGATGSANGTVGYINAVPPQDGYNTKFWGADGTWKTAVTSITLTAGPGITLNTNNEAITTAGSRTISINGINTSTGDENKWLNQKGNWTTPIQSTASLYATSSTGIDNATNLSDPFLRVIDGNTKTNVQLVGGNYITVTANNGTITINNTLTAANLGLASALKYVGTVNEQPSQNDSYANYNNGDVITVGNKEYAYVKGDSAASSHWVELGDEGSYKLKQTAFSNNTGVADGDNASSTFIYSFSQTADGVIQDIKTRKARETIVTLNGTSKESNTASFYAPIDAGQSKLTLISAGSDASPTWYEGLILEGDGTTNSPYDAQFAGKISFGSGDNIEDTIGDVYTPIYWYSGKPSITTPTQQINFSFNKDHKTTSTPIKLTHASIGPNTGVISIIVTSHIERLNGPITWELKSTSNNNVTTYYIELAATANIGSSETITIEGYIIISSMAPNITPNYIT